MPLFRYKAFSEEGKKIRATIEASHLQEAKQKLLRLKIVAIEMEMISHKELQKPLSSKELLCITREIARLLQAGLALYEALSALEEKYKGQKPYQLLVDLSSKVKTGYSLSYALSLHPKTFDVLYISMVAGAEKTGRLEECFEELSHHLLKQEMVKKQVVSALLYPAILSCFCLIVFGSLLFFVIPSLKELFEGRDLHPMTKIVFAMSDWANRSKSLLLVGFIFLIGGSLLFFPSQKGRKILLSFLVKVPGIRNFFAKLALIRFARAASTLLQGGVSLIAALEQAKTVMGHPILEKLVETARQKVAEGKKLSLCFENHPLIPPLVPRMLAIAEEGGKLAFTLDQISGIYEAELEGSLANFTQLAQPILLLVLGGIVGFVLLAVLLPLTDVGSFAS